MSENELQLAIQPEAIFEKSKVYIERAMRAREEFDDALYQFWASLALELLGKTKLAKIHPSLIVHPDHLESLFAACRINIGTDIKTIMWKTIFARLVKIIPEIDNKNKEFCDALAQRRNAELHSGEAPYGAMARKQWEGRYWLIVTYILESMDMTRALWIGGDNAKDLARLVSKTRSTIQSIAEAKLEDAKGYFEQCKKAKKKSKHDEPASEENHDDFKSYNIEFSNHWEVECPACNTDAHMFGDLSSEEIIEYSPVNRYSSDTPSYAYSEEEEEVQLVFTGEAFRCFSCNLHLQGLEEIQALKLEEKHEEQETREREYEEEYMNE